jgi:hypothetical protein
MCSARKSETVKHTEAMTYNHYHYRWLGLHYPKEEAADYDIRTILLEVLAGQHPQQTNITVYRSHQAKQSFLIVTNGMLQHHRELESGWTKRVKIILPSSKVKEVPRQLLARSLGGHLGVNSTHAPTCRTCLYMLGKSSAEGFTSCHAKNRTCQISHLTFQYTCPVKTVCVLEFNLKLRHQIRVCACKLYSKMEHVGQPLQRDNCNYSVHHLIFGPI